MRRGGQRTVREMVEAAVLGIPEGQPFTIAQVSERIKERWGPSRREISNILTHGHLATFRDGAWHREAA